MHFLLTLLILIISAVPLTASETEINSIYDLEFCYGKIISYYTPCKELQPDDTSTKYFGVLIKEPYNNFRPTKITLYPLVFSNDSTDISYELTDKKLSEIEFFAEIPTMPHLSYILEKLSAETHHFTCDKTIFNKRDRFNEVHGTLLMWVKKIALPQKTFTALYEHFEPGFQIWRGPTKK